MFNYKFPDIGEGITEGTLTRWLVKEGDEVTEGQDLAEVETDKMTTTIPSAVSGKVHQLHVKDYGLLEVGKVFITIDDGSGEETQEPAQEEVIKVTPEEQANVTKPVEEPQAEPIEEEETAGVVGEIIASRDVLPPSEEGAVVAKKPDEKKKVLATPVARKLAKDLGVDIQEITGTGPGGRVMKEDIQQFADSKTAAKEVPAATAEPKPATPAAKPETRESVRREPLTRIQQTIIQRMNESKNTLVHTTMIEEIEVSALVEFRERMKKVAGEDVKLTYLPFIMKAIVLALKEYPVMNSSLDEAAGEINYHQNYNIGIATDTERGLVVPVLFDIDKKSIIEIADGIEELAGLARDNKMTLEILRGSTFSITNYGALGGSFGTPIINYPDSAILGVGRIQQKPVVKDGEIVVGHVLPLSLSFDHRIIDGATGVRFMRVIEEALQNPELLLLRS